MLKTYGRWVFGDNDRSVQRIFQLFLVGCAGLFAAWSLGRPQVIASDQESPRGSIPAASDSSSSISTDDDLQSGTVRQSSPTGADSPESSLAAISNASMPVAIVTAVICLMSFYLIALVVWMGLYYRTSAAVPPGLVRDVQELLDQTNYNEAYQRLVADPSFLARVLASAVRRLPAGSSLAQRAMELANEDVTMEMEHRTTYLATVGTLGPMIGLVGTVYGMIIAFRVIALEASTPQASQLAAGISTALYSTLEGIAISIPAIFFYAMYRNRIARLSLEVGMMAELLLDRFAPGVRLAATNENYGTGSAQTPKTYRHPFAINAALKAGTHPARPALPSTEAAQP
jgi:biopolymer transport protein ExbB